MSIATHERRITRLETRMDNAEEDINAHDNTAYETRRDVAGLRIDMKLLLAQFGLPSATAEQIDDALEGQ